MKTHNNRRRWRKWLRDSRKYIRRNEGILGPLDGNGAVAWARRHYDSKPKSIKIKLFTQRSLIGMSNSAKKRAARAVAYRYINDVTMLENALQIATKKDAASFRTRGFPRHDYDRTSYFMCRDFYRIGKKIRPCICVACCPEVQYSIQASVMQPWGWPAPSQDPFRHIAIPANIPCRILYDGYEQSAKIRYFVDGKSRTALIERQYISKESRTICDGSGVLTVSENFKWK